MRRLSSKRIVTAFLCLILSFALVPKLHASAAVSENYIYVVEFSDSTYGTSVVLDVSDGVPLVVTESRENHNDALLSFSNGEEYTLTYVGEFVDGKLSTWTTDESLLEYAYALDESAFGYPVQNEEVTAIYFDTSGTRSTATTTITGAFESEGMVYLQVKRVRDFQFNPGIVLNQSGECVGLLVDSETALPSIFDLDAFESGAASSENPGGSGIVIDNPGTDLPDSPSPSTQESPSETQPEGPSEDTYTLICYDDDGSELFRFEDRNSEGFAVFELPNAPERNGYKFWGWADTKGGPVASPAGKELRLSEVGTKTVYAVYEKESLPVWVYVLIGVIVVGLTAGIIALIVKQKKPPVPPPNPDPETSEVPPLVQETTYGPTEPSAPPPPPPPTGLILHCTGGYQDGRTYPIGEGPVKIGRTAECVIRYPDGTPGVSHVHAVLFWRNGVLLLQDMSSTDTYLKRIGKLVKNQPVQVDIGDVFYIGERKNRFEIMRG